MDTRFAVSCVAGAVGIVLLACVSISRADVLGAGRVEVIYEQITGGINAADDPEDKLAIIDASIEYLQQIGEKVDEAREDSWRVANLFSAPEPVNLAGVRNIIDVARKAEQTINTIGLIMIPIPKPALLPVKLINKAAEGLVGFFAFMTEGVTKSLENLATGMHTANLQALTLADLKEPLYPGLRRKEFVEAYNAILNAGEMHRELGAVSSLLAGNIGSLQQMKAAIQAVEIDYKAWVKQTASLVDSQTREGDYEASAFDERAAAMSAKIDEYAEALGIAGVSQYKSEINEIIGIAKREAEGGAETMKLLESAGDNLEEAKRILAGCDKYGVRAEHHKGLLDGYQDSYDQAMAGLNQDTPSLIDDKAYSPKAFENALYSRDLFGAQLTASGLDDYYESVSDLLGIAAQLLRVEPDEDLIGLPATLPDRLEIPLRVKALNVLDQPLVGKSVNFFGRGDVQVSAVSATTNDDGLSTADIIVWKSIANNTSGSSVRAYIIDLGSTLELNYVFVKPGSPASIDALSLPGGEGAPGTQLPDAWVVAVKDAAGSIVNNIPLAVRFDALDGGGVSPIKTSNESGESLFSAKITLGDEERSYRFRVSLIEPSGYTISQEIAVQADAASPYGAGARDIPTTVGFGPFKSLLAIDRITSDITMYPMQTSYDAPVGGVAVTRKTCEHYKTVKYTDDDGQEKEKQVLDFTHPYDETSAWKLLEDAIPTIVASPSGPVSIDPSSKTITGQRTGQTDIKAVTPGITGYKQTHPNCGRTVAETGTIESQSSLLHIVGIKNVEYTGNEGDIFYWPRLNQKSTTNIMISAEAKVSDGKWEDDANWYLLRNHLFLDVATEGGISFSPDSKYPYRGTLTGTGPARLYGYLKDSTGKAHHRREVSGTTVNSVEVLYPDSCHAGEYCRVEVVVRGGADMSGYYCQWQEKPDSSYDDDLGASSFSSQTGFTRTGPYEWASVNYFLYPEDGVEPFIRSKLSHRFSEKLVERSSGDIIETNFVHWLKINSARINKLRLKARRPGEAGDPYLAFSYDLFTDDTERIGDLLEIHPQAIMGEEMEDYVFENLIKLKLNDGPYQRVGDILNESWNSDDVPAAFVRYIQRVPHPWTLNWYPIYISISRINRPGTLTLASAIFSDDIDEKHYKTALKQGRSVIFSQNKLDITLNVIRVDLIKESGGSYYRLLIDGPAPMDAYVARWRMVGRDGSESIEESAFLRSEDGKWYAEMEKEGAPRTIQAEILDLNGLVLGRAELPDYPPGDVNLDDRVDLVDAVLLLRHLAGLAELTDLQKRLAKVIGQKDFNDIGLADAMTILKVPAGDATALP